MLNGRDALATDKIRNVIVFPNCVAVILSVMVFAIATVTQKSNKIRGDLSEGRAGNSAFSFFISKMKIYGEKAAW